MPNEIKLKDNLPKVCYYCKEWKSPVRKLEMEIGSFSWYGDGFEWVFICRDCEYEL